MIKLPAPLYDGKCDLNRALQMRRSVREFKKDAMPLAQASQLLWAGLGVTSVGGFRTAPSAGALYPLELYLVAGRVEGLEPGVYHYDPLHHTLRLVASGDQRAGIADASLGQTWMANSPAMIAISAVYERTTDKYDERGSRYVHMEVGHVAQNVLLEAVSLDLGAVVVAAFADNELKKILHLPAGEHPLCIIPAGRK